MVFSASLEEPLTWANTTLVRDDAVEAVRAMKEGGSGLMSTIGSISLCRSLLRAGLVDRFRVVMFPVITGATGAERIYDGYPDVALEMIDSRTFDGRIQLVEYRPACSSTHRSTPTHDVASGAHHVYVVSSTAWRRTNSDPHRRPRPVLLGRRTRRLLPQPPCG